MGMEGNDGSGFGPVGLVGLSTRLPRGATWTMRSLSDAVTVNVKGSEPWAE